MFTTIDALPRPRRATALMRALGLLFLVAIIIATLYPLTDWSLRTASPFAFLQKGLPRWWTWFDVLSNVLAYLMLGTVLALGWLSRAHPGRAVLLVTLLCSLLSISLETMQNYLPNRVPSLLDWIANTGGAMVGGWMGTRLSRPFRQHQRLATPTPERWYEQGPPSGWVLLLLWLATQLVPQRLLFATGDFRALAQRLVDWLTGDAGTDLSAWSDRLWDGPSPAAYGMAIEAGVVMCAVCVSGSLVFTLVRGTRLRLFLLTLAALAAFGLRSIATQLIHGSGHALAWLTPGAQGGLVVGASLLYALETLRSRARAAAAVVLALVGLVLVNIAPEDRYFESTLASVQAGQLVNLHGLLRLVSTLWPLAAIAWFWVRMRRSRGRWL